jgi:pimeloyl-ACP methyl ester carboxylesterase
MRYRNLSRYAALLFVIVAGLWLFGPREPASLSLPTYDMAAPGDLDAYLTAREAVFDDIVSGTEKSIVWADKRGTQTDIAIVYIHGFSASAKELQPVPNHVANALGANLFFTRLTGHGRGSMAMQTASVASWMQDMAEALAIGRRIGRNTIIIATSTGGTLAAAAALDAAAMTHVAGIVFIAPNFGLQNKASPVLTWPFARQWVPPLVGAMRDSPPRNPLHARYWTTRYPTVALLPMAALVDRVVAADLASVTVPALFYFSPDDKIVRPDRTATVAGRWGGPASVVTPVLGQADDPLAHIIAGDIVSPGQTASAVAAILAWVRAL